MYEKIIGIIGGETTRELTGLPDNVTDLLSFSRRVIEVIEGRPTIDYP